MSAKDIPPGSVWFGKVLNEIDESNYAIACLTDGNINSQWMLWEAGALYGKLFDRSRIVPLLTGVPKAKIEGPLSMFQIVESTNFDEVSKLMRDLNLLADRPIPEDVLSERMLSEWGKLESAVTIVLKRRQPYALTWRDSRNLFCKLDGDLQKIGLFMINTGATIDEVRHLRWARERTAPGGGASFFVLQDRPVRVLVLNSIAQRIIGYMRDRYGESVFCPPDVTGFWAGEVPPNEPPLEKPDPPYGPWRGVGGAIETAWKYARLPEADHLSIGLESLRATFEHRLLQVGIANEDIDILLGRNPKISDLFQLRVKHLATCVEKICDPEAHMDWMPRSDK